MDILYLIISSIIILTCFYFVSAPFFTAKEEAVTGLDSGEDSLTLEAIYSAVNELEMDYLMKKIKEADYVHLKEQYQLLAVKVMKTEIKPAKNDKKKQNADVDKVELEILEELKKIRKQKGK